MNKNKTYSLKASKRELTGKKVKKIRAEGLIPASLYGSKKDPAIISVKRREFEKVFSEAGTSSLIDLSIDSDNSIKVLSQEPQNNPISGEAIHVDFYRIDMDNKIKTEIPLNVIGTSEAVEQLGGNLVKNKDSVDVECLPGDLVSEIDVDITVLKTFDVTIKISDLSIPKGIEVLNEPEDMIALVEEPRSEEELAELG